MSVKQRSRNGMVILNTMKKVNVRFDLKNEIKDIDVVFSASQMDDQVISLMNRVRDPLAEKITVYDSSGSAVTIPEKNIISIAIESKKLRVVADEGTYELKVPLRSIEKVLHPTVFLRISRYEIINLDKVKKFDFPISGSLQIEMKNGMKTWASRRCISEIKNRFRGKEQNS